MLTFCCFLGLASKSKREGHQVQTLMQPECLSTNRYHLARMQVFMVFCPIGPHFIIALPHLSKLVNVTFGNCTSVTIMSNKVVVFKFPFERACPHLTLRSFTLQLRTAARSLTKRCLLTPLWHYQARNKSHKFAQRQKRKADRYGPKRISRNKKNFG